MLMNYIIICATVSILIINSPIGVLSLRWSSSGAPKTYTTVHMKTVVIDKIIVDVSYGKQVTIVRDIQSWNRSLTIQCFIEGFNSKRDITYSFCKNEDPCINVNDRNSPLMFNEYNLEGSIETTFPDKRGFTVNLRVPNKYMDTSGRYFCKAENDKIIIMSNYVEIRDSFFWERKMFTKVESSFKSDIKSISMESLPAVLNCSDGSSILNSKMPAWSKAQFSSPVAWSVCPVLKNYNQLTSISKMSAEKCLSYTSNQCDINISPSICPRPLSKMPYWKYYVNERGDLIFTDIPYENANTGDTYLLMCYTKNSDDDLQAISYFLNKKNDATIESGIAIDGSLRTSTQKLEAISPLIQDVVIYARDASTDLAWDPVAIYGLYKSSSEASFQWQFNSVNINSNNVMTVTKYMVIFNKEIPFDIAGRYTLEIVDKTEKLTMVMNVLVVGVPVLAKETCLPALTFVWEHDNVNLRCEYNLRPSGLQLFINSQEIKSNDYEAIRQMQLKSSYPYLSELNFNVTILYSHATNSSIIGYSAINLRRSSGQEKYQDHSITFLASNQFGMTLKSTTIYVVPRLKTMVSYFPEKDNCTTPCSSLQSHKFRCNVDVKEYINKELIVDQFWSVGGEKIDGGRTMFGPYFTVDPKTNELTLLPILSSNPFDLFVRSALNDTYLECHVNIRSVNTTSTQLNYQSSLDSEIVSRMRARIMLDTSSITKAGNYWIVAVVLGGLVVLLVVVFLVYRCQQRRALSGPRSTVMYDPAKKI